MYAQRVTVDLFRQACTGDGKGDGQVQRVAGLPDQGVTLVKELERAFRHHVGVADEEHTVYVLDEDYWTEILGEDVHQGDEKKSKAAKKPRQKALIKFPLPIQAEHKGQVYQAELLDIGGQVRYQREIYKTPTGAAKVITTDWKSVNGWDFWRYVSSDTGKQHKIGTLK